MKITVLGAGSWGTTLAILLANKRHEVRLWAHRPEFARALEADRENKRYLKGVLFPENLHVVENLHEAVKQAEMIVAAVPSHALRETAAAFADLPLSGKVIVNVAKGIELESGKRMSEVLLETLPGVAPEQIAALYGPSHAEEVAQKQPTTVVACSVSEQTACLVQEVFHTNGFRVYVNTDLIGVEIAGSVKNIIAIAAGVSDGLGFGDNAKAAIITRGLAEISRLSTKLGADPLTLSGLSGIGDLVVTCLSQHSRNRYVGEQIGKGRKLDDVISEMSMVAEGVLTSKAVVKLAERLGVEMPISQAVYEMLFEDKPAQQAILDLMEREPKPEHY
ncbi:NAD(P)H-dependent glycerol-3-phosphate dehydrogenase [Chlorobaculum sp. 24CR]|uniref:NAD(P)H-dependent glycerol-3-phosphate dehydrogenase n=1 Tax=Chlorobaculum sp. 24CR TaxID=2508878 RepID=UPI00100B6FF1|nr:NAD(P)H-dependent glycerol-3-phosphate dehydrogenase [Chlorobaculum sp. 24CR]RXK87724.1 NAD(P)H-dependent glycerol-3-phosphate dehydrogenase [Chlorobaculum sp. 24CR]